MQWFSRLERLASGKHNTTKLRQMLMQFVDRIELQFERKLWGKSKSRYKCELVGGTVYFKVLGVDYIGGPLLDRIDIHIEVPAVPFEELSSKQDGTSSATIRQCVELARSTQKTRFGNSSLYNAQMSSRQLREFCPLERSCRVMLQNCCNDLGLSARAHDKILRVSRTIADLDDSPEIQETHLQEAINYRMLDRNLFA
jgi:hypothetical protein